MATQVEVGNNKCSEKYFTGRPRMDFHGSKVKRTYLTVFVLQPKISHSWGCHRLPQGYFQPQGVPVVPTPLIVDGRNDPKNELLIKKSSALMWSQFLPRQRRGENWTSAPQFGSPYRVRKSFSPPTAFDLHPCPMQMGCPGVCHLQPTGKRSVTGVRYQGCLPCGGRPEPAPLIQWT